MDTMELERRVIKAQVSRTPTDGKGTFDFSVHPFEIDSDNERIKNFTNVAEGRKTPIPVDYQHTTEEIDPGGTIGQASVAQKGDSLSGTANLHIDSNPMAMAVYERLLLPDSDPLHLSEVSIFYAFEPSKAFTGTKGELVQVDCELLGIAVVHKGAQRTAITNVKNEKAVDRTSWDGAAAMASCSSAGDYRRIAFERNNTSDPATAAHWALPHHMSPGMGPNAGGVAAAIGALNGARGGAPDLKDSAAARSHLEGHQSEIQSMMSENAKTVGTVSVDVVPRLVGWDGLLYPATNTATWTSDALYEVAKAGRTLSSKNEAKLRQATDLLTQVLQSVDKTPTEEPQKEGAKAEEPEGAKAEEPPTESEPDARAQWDELLKPLRPERG